MSFLNVAAITNFCAFSQSKLTLFAVQQRVVVDLDSWAGFSLWAYTRVWFPLWGFCENDSGGLAFLGGFCLGLASLFTAQCEVVLSR